MASYYNENDPFAAQWLLNLIAAGHIAPGDVDDRSILDVRPDDLAGYTQCHFFAGIGGWSLALRGAGWVDSRTAWTGSCPCQPFSEVGKRAGFTDDRDLWPAWRALIAQCRPAVIFGEQVPEAIGLGWLDRLSVDLEAEGYAVGAAVLSACAVEARQERERLWFVASANGEPLERPAVPRMERHTWPAEPDVARVAHGISEHRRIVRAFGNAIIPKAGADFVAAYIDCEREAA